MGDAAGQLADRVELLRLQQLRLEHLGLGQADAQVGDLPAQVVDLPFAFSGPAASTAALSSATIAKPQSHPRHDDTSSRSERTVYARGGWVEAKQVEAKQVEAESAPQPRRRSLRYEAYGILTVSE